MTALLGLVALAGYQNRDKIAEMLKGGSPSAALPGSTTTAPLGGLFRNLGGTLGGVGAGGLLSGGIGDLLDKSSRAAMARRLSLGSIVVPTNKFLRLT